ncbi:MAG: toxin-antitoxin system YwqK family antitoxin [Planctomycetota bacterium]
MGLSNDDGQSWLVRKLNDGGLLDEDGKPADVKSVGYVTACQSDDGLIHVVTTTELHITFNEAWILQGDAGIAAEEERAKIVPETIREYSENHPNGRTKVVWSAGLGGDGRYLLHGTETWYYGTGKKQWQTAYDAGRKTGQEKYWSSEGTIRWSRQHEEDGTSTWTLFDRKGGIKAESVWCGKKLIAWRRGP